MHKEKKHFPKPGVLTIFFDLGFVPGRRGRRRMTKDDKNDDGEERRQ